MTDEPEYGTVEDFKRMLGGQPKPEPVPEPESSAAISGMPEMKTSEAESVDSDEHLRKWWSDFILGDRAKREADAEWIRRLHGGGGDEAA